MAGLVLIGPPGAGKGTQAKMLEERFRLTHISSGDLLRAALEEDSPEGRRVKAHMEKGELVPDGVVLSLIEGQLGRPNGKPTFLLDGFPRTVSQAEALASMLDRLHRGVDAAVSIEVPEKELISRLGGRRTCRVCGAMYHMKFDPPKLADVCDRCGGELYRRDDDNEATIRARLQVFLRQTQPVLAYYRQRGKLVEVDGMGSPADVFDRLVAALHLTA